MHSHAVHRAFLDLGLSAAIFCNDEFPIASTITLDPESAVTWLSGPNSDHDLSSFKVVWNRRSWNPAFSSEIHPDDERLAKPICRRFLDELRYTPTARQVWVNPRSVQLSINSKYNQLTTAKAAGFRTPRTIISNDPERVRAFVGQYKACIVKPLSTMSWREDDGLLTLPTSTITLEDCSEDFALQSCPMVYQELVEKAYELRVIVFGDDLLCVRLDTQHGDRYRTDWRLSGTAGLNLLEVESRPELARNVRRFCDLAGIVHGSFDFAVTPDDDLVFFEVNEQGQTLWIEECNSDIKILDRLVQFLAALDPASFRARPGTLRLTDFLSSETWRRIEADRAQA